MEKLDSFKVDLKGMISDTVSYQWHIDDRFFSAVQGPEIQQGQLDASLQVKRTSGVYELTFGFAGTVKVACDRCMELMDQPVEAEQFVMCILRENALSMQNSRSHHQSKKQRNPLIRDGMI